MGSSCTRAIFLVLLLPLSTSSSSYSPAQQLCKTHDNINTRDCSRNIPSSTSSSVLYRTHVSFVPLRDLNMPALVSSRKKRAEKPSAWPTIEVRTREAWVEKQQWERREQRPTEEETTVRKEMAANVHPKAVGGFLMSRMGTREAEDKRKRTRFSDASRMIGRKELLRLEDAIGIDLLLNFNLNLADVVIDL